ncbi:MAG: cytochrome-c peroxidase [Sulfurospirillum sp.]|nr:MAG: cytochrome-c peroxidase [Sulfurospirillum sp.]
MNGKLRNGKLRGVILSVGAVLFLANCGGGGTSLPGGYPGASDQNRSDNSGPDTNATDQNASTQTAGAQLSKKEELGKKIFFDTTLSANENMSCASCHAPGSGFVDPDSDLPVSEGSFPGLFGNRNAPTAAYASFVPHFHYDANESLYIGGLFLDGRATGDVNRSALVDQAQGPFLNPVEMAMPDGAAVARKVQDATYAPMMKEVYGENVFDDLNQTYIKIAEAIAAFESTKLFHPFDSKYDHFLNGDVNLTDQEMRGLTLFKGKAKCSECHIADVADDGSHPLFTDFTYDNLGVPANPENPFYDLNATFNPDGLNFKDKGLGAFLKSQGESSTVYRAEYGKFRVPTLRNIAITGPYMHNGVFKTLREVVSFYNTRDVRNWPQPEEVRNVNSDELGNLGLTEQEVGDIVAFLKTLTDGYSTAQK